MNRRRFLAAATVAAVSTTGCLDADSPVTDDGIESTTFEVRDGHPLPVDADARVTFRPKASQVTVVGAMESGNPCTVATLESATFHSQERSLTLTVGTKPTGDILTRFLGCPDSMGIAQFELAVTMETELPQTVTVRERPFDTLKQTTTVRRSSQ